ncbi:formin-like protein 5 [Sus scrofa]|uniref:formin-like protein 5 n=1 Tax=Sus scrofa TaxID=9823 RepID=UPI000A2B6C85|nr:formin-like protein 5 [Sus scrofa]
MSGSAVNTALCVSFSARVVLSHSQKNGNDGGHTRALLSSLHPLPSPPPLSTWRPPARATPLAALGPGGPVPGSPRRAAASLGPSLPPQRRRRELGARPRLTDAPALTPPLRLPSPSEKVSRCVSPRRQGVHSPPKGSSCRTEAGARARLATSHLPASTRPESPQPLTWPWQRARAEDRGWPAPRPGLVSPPPVGSQRRAQLARPPSSEVLAPPVAGVSLAGSLAARSVPRGGARRPPPRPEADSSGAAPPASPEPPRRGPPRPLPPPRLSASRRLGAREGPSGLPALLEWSERTVPYPPSEDAPNPGCSPQHSVPRLHFQIRSLRDVSIQKELTGSLELSENNSRHSSVVSCKKCCQNPCPHSLLRKSDTS